MANPPLNRPLSIVKPLPALHVENSHGSALRSSSAFLFDASIAALAAAASNIIRFTTGDKAVLMESSEFSINQEKVKIEVYEDVTFTDPGSHIPKANLVTNMNRINPKDTQLVFFGAPTIDSQGIRVLHQDIFGIAGQNVNQPGVGASSQTAARIFKPNTEHVFIVTNESVLAVDIDAHFEYHEVNPNEYK